MNRTKHIKLLLLGTSNGTCDIISYAQSRGIYTIVTDYLEPNLSEGKLVADEYWMINTGNLDVLEERCKNVGVNAIFCGVSGFNLRMCMELAPRLGVPFYLTKDMWNKTGDGDKAYFKKICRDCNAPVAQDYFVSLQPTEQELQSVQFPVVVKPVDKGGNTGISFCDNIDELKNAIDIVRKVSSNPGIIIERKITGEEWFASYACHKGEIRFLSLNAMYHEHGYPAFCYSLTTTVSRYLNQFLSEINAKIEEVLHRMGCTDGYVWVQVMRDELDEKFYIIEMGCRLDSDMLYMPIKYIRGYDVTKAMVDYACGIEDDEDDKLPQLSNFDKDKCGAGIRFWTKKACKISKIEGLDVMAKLPNTYIEMRRHVGDELDIYRYLGTITVAAENCDELCRIIDIVNREVHVYDENGEDVIIKYTDFDKLRAVYAKRYTE